MFGFGSACWDKGVCRSCGKVNIIVSLRGPTRGLCRRCIWDAEHKEYQYCQNCAFDIATGRPPLAKCHACYMRNWYPNDWKNRDPVACQACGELFKQRRADAKFCSNACRQKAYRAAKPAAVATPPTSPKA
jgi:hypothetical protein